MAGATPDKQVIRGFEEDFEIVSIEGTLSAEDCHIHIALSNQKGKVIGGHLKEGIVSFTAEVSILELKDRKFMRQPDKETGFEELVIKPAN